MPEENGAGRTLTISEETARRLEERIQGTAFDSLDTFVDFVLARLLESSTEGPFSEEEERRLREQLRSLGYID
ncbi:MAG TPA: CopG family transcriptional regulator [Thermoplasmata archaeon]|nr:CopG family transcriptional regulator [Thermoplasmata archaeon]